MTGAMPDNGAVSGSIGKVDGSYTIPAGYHNGKGSVTITSEEQAKLVADNIKAGVTILGSRPARQCVDTQMLPQLRVLLCRAKPPILTERK